MSAILLSAHVIVAILAVGPIAVAASMFPRYAREGSAVAGVLYRICQTYAVVGVAVPFLGIATAVSMGVLTQVWVMVSIASPRPLPSCSPRASFPTSGRYSTVRRSAGWR